MFEDHSSNKRRRTDMSEAGEQDPAAPALPPEENLQHGMRVLHGLSRLKLEGILCDVTLIAEGIVIWTHCSATFKIIIMAYLACFIFLPNFNDHILFGRIDLRIMYKYSTRVNALIQGPQNLIFYIILQHSLEYLCSTSMICYTFD